MSRCEFISHDFFSIRETPCAIPGLRVVNPEVATLLGCLIGSVEGIKEAIISKVENLRFLGSRLHQLRSYDAFCLHHAFAMPKLFHSL